MFFDSHCHLTAAALAPDFEGVLERARRCGVTGFLNVADRFESARAAIAQVRRARALGYAMWTTAGVHPQNATLWDEDSASVLGALAGAPEVRAIGEIGLDYLYDETHPRYPGATRAVQEHVLLAQLEVARRLALPVVLHNREADARLPDLMAAWPDVRGVLHCFSSPPNVARRVLDCGFYLGFTGNVTFKNADAIREAAKVCPLDRMLIETDAPYLAPVPHRGKTNEPSYVPLVAATIARLHGVTPDVVGAVTSANARALFGLDTEPDESDLSQRRDSR
jgi:TatD DNase family protein